MSHSAAAVRRPCRRRPPLRLALAVVWIAAGAPVSLCAQNESVISTLHNLSVTGPGEVRALSETEVCKFCHVPHNAEAPEPLWGHALSTALYEVPEIGTGADRRPAPQPDGSSRLCLSCHDGTVALGDIASEPRPIEMVGGDRLRPGRSGHLGLDLSGSHPISFVVPDEDLAGLRNDSDMGLRALSSIRSDPDVALDSEGKMQCTSCHDAHADRYYQPERVPRFWVKPSLEDVCLTCHAPR